MIAVVQVVNGKFPAVIVLPGRVEVAVVEFDPAIIVRAEGRSRVKSVVSKRLKVCWSGVRQEGGLKRQLLCGFAIDFEKFSGPCN